MTSGQVGPTGPNMGPNMAGHSAGQGTVQQILQSLFDLVLNRVLGPVDGYKTYLLGASLIAYGLYQILVVKDLPDGVQAVWQGAIGIGGAIISLRHAVAKATGRPV